MPDSLFDRVDRGLRRRQLARCSRYRLHPTLAVPRTLCHLPCWKSSRALSRSTKGRGGPSSKFLHTVTFPYIDHSQRVVAAVPLRAPKLTNTLLGGWWCRSSTPTTYLYCSTPATIHNTRSCRLGKLGGFVFGKVAPQREHGLPRRWRTRSTPLVRLTFDL